MTPREKAEQFIEEDKKFRLGGLITEQSHPITRNLSDALKKSIPSGLKKLLDVDLETLPILKEIFESSKFTELIQDLHSTLKSGGRVFFTGCGATGRLSILLESSWREACKENTLLTRYENQLFSIMAGGDYALIKSVEGFEDFTNFGKEQIRSFSLTSKDMVVSITEGGETSFVIGTAWAGVEASAKTWFVYNNPTELLCQTVERSCKIIQNPSVKSLDLTTGPMAIAGSTRMQATTVELLIIGSALECCLHKLLQKSFHAPATFYKTYKDLLLSIQESDNLLKLAKITENEACVFSQGGTVTYLANYGSLDLLTDTTERAPTFSIPSFRKKRDRTAPLPFCILKDPCRNNEETWEHLLQRPIRGIDWVQSDYKRMKAPNFMIENPPFLSRESLLEYPMDSEEDKTRNQKNRISQLTHFLVESDFSQNAKILQTDKSWFQDFSNKNSMIVRSKILNNDLQSGDHSLQISYPGSSLRLWEHLSAKLILNTHSTACMGLADRIQGNWMIHVQATNKKLIDRASRLIADLGKISYSEACIRLHESIELISYFPPEKAKPSPAWFALQQLHSA